MKKLIFWALMLALVLVSACDDQAVNIEGMNKVKTVHDTTTVDRKVELLGEPTRDNDYGYATVEMRENGKVVKDTTITVPLGNVKFFVDANDTVVVDNNTLIHVSFKLDDAVEEKYETAGVYYTRSTRKFVDTYTKYVKNGYIAYLDAYTYVWGYRVDFPAAQGTVAYVSSSPSSKGTKGKYNYTLCTSQYETSFMGKKLSDEQGFYTLAVEEEDKLVSGPTKTDEGFEIIRYSDDGNPSVARSWIELTEQWSLSGEKKSKFEVLLYIGVEAPAYDIKYVQSFGIEQQNQTISSATNGGERADGQFKIIKKQVRQTVKNTLFDRVFVYSYEVASLELNGKTFQMPYREFKNIKDLGFEMNPMESIDGYDRMKNTYHVEASFDDKPVKASCETELRVPEKEDELEDEEVVSEGFDYVNATTSDAWMKIRQKWSKSGYREVTKHINLFNGISAPAEVIKILSNFSLTQKNGSLGPETLVNTEEKNEFTVRTYQRTYTVGTDKFTREFILTYQKAVYNPLKHSMKWKAYENVSDGGFKTADMENKTSGEKIYLRKSYNHAMSAVFNSHSASSSAQAELWVETSDKMTSQKVVDSGIEYVNATTSRSWVKITEIWSLSGTKTYTKEVNLTNGITAPDKITKILDNFTLNKKGASLGSEAKGASRTSGDFTITKYSVTYTVGNDKFTQVFTLSYERAVYNPMKYNMPSKAYENVSDGGFTTADMTNITSNGKTYLRKSYTHKMSAVFNSHSASSSAAAELWVETKDEMTSQKVVRTWVDYINLTTNKLNIEIEQTWSLSGKKTVKDAVDVFNSIEAPEKVIKEVSDFNISKVAATTGSVAKVGTRTSGNFTVTKYKYTYTVGTNKETRVFTLTYETAVYTPLKYNMPEVKYSNLTDGGYTTSDLTNTTSGGKTYARKLVTHKMSATINAHSASSSAEAELRVAKQEETRETPNWLGAPVSAKYTRVQKTTGDKFEDMIVFTYTNGVVMAPNGKVDMSLCYAFDASVASKNGVDRCLKNASYSGVWTGSKWAPAGITITNGRWMYAGLSASWDHTVMENNAINLGIGVDVTPIPKAQSYSISGNKITIKYAKNNSSVTATSSLDLR